MGTKSIAMTPFDQEVLDTIYTMKIEEDDRESHEEIELIEEMSEQSEEKTERL